MKDLTQTILSWMQNKAKHEYKTWSKTLTNRQFRDVEYDWLCYKYKQIGSEAIKKEKFYSNKVPSPVVQ